MPPVLVELAETWNASLSGGHIDVNGDVGIGWFELVQFGQSHAARIVGVRYRQKEAAYH